MLINSFNFVCVFEIKSEKSENEKDENEKNENEKKSI